MKIILTNEINGYKVTFLEKPDFVNFYGYENTLFLKYDTFVNNSKTFLMSNHAGFYGNNVVNPTFTRGVNEDGENFKANFFGARQIGFEFQNVFSRIEGVFPPISPNNYLNTLLMAKNDVIKVEVETNGGIFSNYFSVLSETSTEGGVIQMQSAYGGTGIFWETIQEQKKIFWFNLQEQNNYNDLEGLVDKILPRLLDRKAYPFKFYLFTQAIVSPIFKVGGNKTGFFENIHFKNVTTNEVFSFENSYKDLYITFDFENNKVFNENGISRFENFTGSLDFNLINGNNEIEVYTGDGLDLVEDSKNLPLNFNISVAYKQLVNSIDDLGVACYE